MARRVRRSPARKPAAPRSRVQKSPAEPLTAGVGERVWFLDPPFRATLPGAQLDRARKEWVFIGPCLPDSLMPFGSTPYSRLRWLEDDANGRAGAVPVGVAPKTPRDIQVSGAAAISRAAAAGWRQFLLTDDVGTGKTITLWLAALEIAAVNVGALNVAAVDGSSQNGGAQNGGALDATARRGAAKILVLVDRPAAITIPHWRNTIASIGDGGHRVLISSPDQLPKLLSRNGRPWARWDIVIADECHLYRHVSTRRTQVFRRLARFSDPPAKAPFVMLASATPAQHPAELTYLAPVLAQLRGQEAAQWTDFGGRLAESGLPILRNTYGKWVWDEHAQADPSMQQAATATVRSWLADNAPPLTLHRAAPWGPAPLDLMPVELTPAERVAYLSLWSEFRATIAELAAGAEPDRLAKRSGAPRTAAPRTAAPRTAAIVRAGRTAVLRFRQKASLLRVDASVAWVAAQVEAGYQVAVSCEFLGAAAVPLAEALQAKGLPVARIHGAVGDSAPDLEGERRRFQTGAAQVVVFTPSASLSLQAGEHLADGSRASSASRVGLMHNVRYSGLAGRQILGRTHRDHQVSPWWVSYAEGTVEEAIAVTMIERFRATADTAGADSTALTRIAELLGVPWVPGEALAASD